MLAINVAQEVFSTPPHYLSQLLKLLTVDPQESTELHADKTIG